ncbi:hypothetical protein D0C36_20395 [Mucilaginibacter conchicola]|uniref:Uncharacterized protein n=1 Tax=Mucilaginibacter conchicola TaxID=2303333 RepID=A0A372NQU5_9SPHI|nr:hypothetical protein [Mucilaginibacter conchicola]RFZ91292.1 hypothetical protein D0C36_20395 [Mucilaginibacter conchicola]
MGYEVSRENGAEIISVTESGLKVVVREKKRAGVPAGKPYLLVTEYIISGGFVPARVMLFEALSDPGLEALKAVADFYFGVLLDTELYVKEVPADSSLYGEEAVRLYGTGFLKDDDHDRAVNALRGFGADERAA